MAQPQQLKRELGVFGATILGLGSILGTGVFVSIAFGTAVAGPWVLLAIIVAGFIATCNGMSSAQLAAAHPVSGGTYEYGYQYLTPTLGFTAGWMFMIAKSASAATAALGFAAYMLDGVGVDDVTIRIVLALAAVTLFTVLVLVGLRRSHQVNTLLVGATIAALLVFIVGGAVSILIIDAWHDPQRLLPEASDALDTQSRFNIAAFLQACALMFVAYTGYGRIATMGEEITEPRKNIPRAIITTLAVSALLYVGVGAVIALGVSPAIFTSVDASGSPLVVAGQQLQLGWSILLVIAIGAIIAMLGVLLNLILGLSRVLLAMGRRHDVPAAAGTLNASGTTPVVATIVVGLIIGGLALLGDVRTTWSLSAFTVLVYYGLTNAAALRLPADDRLYPRLFSWLGLVGCLFLAFWVDVWVWVLGLGLIVVGLIWRAVWRSVAVR